MTLPDFSCPVYTPDDWSYWEHVYQYATTSNPAASMSPAAIICPKYPNADSDVKKAIQYAAADGIGVAIRTGGHAYSGTSSTAAPNVQLDLSEAYTEWTYNPETGLVRSGVSHSLLEFNGNLKAHGLFMPTGQCYNVHIGGHVQTGGYGQLSRAFGLFSDHIISFEMIFADGSQREIFRDSKSELDRNIFFAVLGGGPGNYGVMTHFTIRPLKDSDHQYARAFKEVIPYDPKVDHKVLVQLFNLVQDWARAPGDYDFSFTIGSGEADYLANQIGIASWDDFMVRFLGGKPGASPFDFLSVYFQYSNLDNSPESYDSSWCDRIKAILSTANMYSDWSEYLEELAKQAIIDLAMTQRDDDVTTPISQSVTELWTYQGVREFNYPFLKNAQVTDKVATREWSEWAATRIDMMTGRSSEGLMVVVQCQNFGGEASAVTKNGKSRQTSYAWRDTTVGYSLDVFYDARVENALAQATQWQDTNISEGVKKDHIFSMADHRWFWASHGCTDMSKVWPFYYSSADDYAKCCEVKKTIDPKGVFTPNKFVVGYTQETAPKHLALVAAPPTSKPEKALDDAAFAKGHVDRAKQRAEAKGIATAKLFRTDR